jgi:hypothetical protein
MTSEKQINEKILAITMKIQCKYPELSKYLNELPVTIPIENDPEINTKVLNDYYESLVKLISTYELEIKEKENQKN